MTIITELREAQRLADARRRPNLPLTSFSVRELLAEIQAEHFAGQHWQVDVSFISVGSLACMMHDDDAAHIYIHQLLNHTDTPPEVFQLVLCHELLHLQIEPAEENGQVQQHPPAFWEAERRICPQRTAAWCWIWINFADCLKRRPKLERTDVLPGWRKVWSRPRLPVRECLELARVTLDEDELSGW